MGLDSIPRPNIDFVLEGSNTFAGSRLRLWHVVVLLAFVLAGLGLTYYDLHSVVEVRVTSPSFRDIQTSISTMGKVVPVGEFQARASFSGMVETINVHLGQTVTSGQLLVGMKDPFASSRVASATAALQSVEVSDENIRNNGSREDRINFASDYEHAQMEQKSAAGGLSVLRDLRRDGSASDAEIYGAEQRLQSANATMKAMESKNKDRYSPADVASWKSRVTEAKATLKAEKLNFANSQITSPIAGTVYLISARPYDFVSVGADLVRIADLGRLEVRALFDEPEIGALATGEPVTLRWEGRPDEVWHGHIEHVPMSVFNSGARSVGESIITIDGPVRDLPANTNVNVSVLTGQRTHVLAIPREALHIDGPNSYVYRDVGGRLVKTPIDIGMVNLDDAEIKKGLGPNDLVALHALSGLELRDNLKIGEVR